MKSKGKTARNPESRPVRLGLARLLALAALGLSGYLLWGSLAGDALPGCGVDSGCGTVLHSRWSKWFGIPVSLPALLLYILILVATGLVSKETSAPVRSRLWGFLVMAATSLIGAAVWFVCLQFFVIEAICPFCMTAHGCGLAIGVILLAQAPWSVRRTPQGETAPGVDAIWNGGLAAAAGLLGVVALALGQVFYQPPSFDVQAMTSVSPVNAAASSNSTPANATVQTNSPSVAAQAVSPSNAAPVLAKAAPVKAPRIIGLHDNLFELNLDELPLIGSADAPFVIVEFFDYSCQHCRVLHPLLLKAVQELSNQLAVVSLPLPLATNCNRMIKRSIRDHVNACEYAMDGLALWRANPTKLHEFANWIFTPTRPAHPVQTRAEAMRLAGTNAFNNALQDPWVTNRLEQNIRIFETNYARYKRSALPQLMIGTNIVTGNFRSVDDLYKLLAAQFPIQLPVKATSSPPRPAPTNTVK